MPKPFDHHDKYLRRAKYQGYRARSVFKLKELDQNFKLFKDGDTVLDVAAFPGSWLQYISEKIGPEGKALGVDLKYIKKVADNVTLLVSDVTETETTVDKIKSLGFNDFDIIVSDISPNTTGIYYVDHKRSVELTEYVIKLYERLLRPNGHLVMKVFDGPDYGKLTAYLRPKFKEITTQKVNASRDRSKEVYLICLGRKNY